MSEQRSQFLGDEMGLGKTISLGAAILFRNRLQRTIRDDKYFARLHAQGIMDVDGHKHEKLSNEECQDWGFPVFKPSLVLCTVNAIGNFCSEIRRFFPTIRIILYYGHWSCPIDSSAELVSGAEFKPFMDGLWCERFKPVVRNTFYDAA